MADEPRTRQEVLARYLRNREDLDAVLARLSDEQMLTPGPGGGWSARDTLAHIGASHRWVSGQLQAYLDDRLPTVEECYGDVPPPGPEHDLMTNEGRNQLQWEQNRHLSLDQVRDLYREYSEKLARVVEQLSDEDMESNFTIAPLGFVFQIRAVRPGEQGTPPWQWLGGSMWRHYAEHIPDFEAAASR